MMNLVLNYEFSGEFVLIFFSADTKIISERSALTQRDNNTPNFQTQRLLKKIIINIQHKFQRMKPCPNDMIDTLDERNNL